MSKFDIGRWKIMFNGKWAGGSFATEAEAKLAAAKMGKPGDKVEVVPKGAPLSSPKK